MYTLTVKEHFDAAHFLKNYNGKCAKVHGHTWAIDVEIEGNILDEIGMVVDFSDVKKTVRKLLPDHEFLNEVIPVNPTAENLSKYFFEMFKEEFSGKPYEIKSVTLWESPACGCKYSI